METGRDREIKLIRNANKAAAVGRLMLGEIKSWQEFLEVETFDLKSISRKKLKSGASDVKARLNNEIEKFTRRNFEDASQKNLVILYEKIKVYRGLEMPLTEFEEKFFKIKKSTYKGHPSHLTVSISLWGLKFQYPEDELSKDISEGLSIAVSVTKELNDFKKSGHSIMAQQQNRIGEKWRLRKYASRSVLISCFNLMEAYLNGLAWDFRQNAPELTLSNREKDLLDDSFSVSIRDKLKRYPKIISRNENWEKEAPEIDSFLEIIKPFRDSLVHPSPFNAPEKFGGYNKLRNLYRIDVDTAVLCSNLTVTIIEKIHNFINSEDENLPGWLMDLKEKVQNIAEITEESENEDSNNNLQNGQPS